MNQDQVKQLLTRLDADVPEYGVVFTGKQSRKVDGLYKPQSREILLHNKNFETDDALIYTAIHEFAHHLHFSRYPDEVGSRPHAGRFRELFHNLLEKAEGEGLYRSLFDTDEDFVALTLRIRRDFVGKNGELMKEFGKRLLEARDLCRKKNAVFEDYVERVIGLKRGSAKTMMKVYTLDVDASLGYENMKTVASLGNPADRRWAEDAMKKGMSPPQVGRGIRDRRGETEETVESLRTKKRRLERSLSEIRAKLAEVEGRLSELGVEEMEGKA